MGKADSTAVKTVIKEKITNDLVIEIATANGTGSQSANMILMRSVFNMGIPVSHKNMFPSNIQGLPTWFTVRANKDGYLARKDNVDIMVCMNPASVAEDIGSLSAGSILVLNENLKNFLNRDDLIVYEVPFNKLVKKACPESRLQKKVINMLYVGVLASLLNIDMKAILAAIQKQFKKSKAAVELNAIAIKSAFDWANENLTTEQP